MIFVTANIPDERFKHRPPHLHWKFDSEEPAYVFIAELHDRFGDSVEVHLVVMDGDTTVCQDCRAEV